jgi:hypothetical protein
MRYYANSGFFVITILFFLLPFLEIKCKDEPFAHMSGIDLALKKGMTFTNDETTSYMKDSEEFKSLQKNQNKNDPFTIISISLLLLAAILQLILKKKRELLSIIVSGTVIIVLIIMQITYKIGWEKQMDEMGSMKTMFPLTLHFGYGYWLTIVFCTALIALNTFFVLNNRKVKRALSANIIHPFPNPEQQI